MRISVADIRAVDGYADTTNPNSCVSYVVGSARSGEIFNKSATVFRSPGLISNPMAVGSFDGYGNFTSSTSSPTCSQALCVETNSHWFTIGTRDTRNQSLLTATATGETRLFAEGNPANSIYLDIAGNCWIKSPNNIVQQPTNGAAISLIKSDGSISLLTTSDNTSTGTTVGLGITTSQINLGNQYGSLNIDSTGITLTAGGCSITLTPAGQLTINGQIINIQGVMTAVSGELGTFVGVGAAPLPIQAALSGMNGPSAKPSSNVFLGL